MRWFDDGATAMRDDTDPEETRLRAAARRAPVLDATYAAGRGACRGLLGGLLCLVLWMIGALLAAVADGTVDAESALTGGFLLAWFGLIIVLPVGLVAGAVLGLVLLPVARAMPPTAAAGVAVLLAIPVPAAVLSSLTGSSDTLLVNPEDVGLLAFVWGPALASAGLAAAYHAFVMARLHRRATGAARDGQGEGARCRP